ncbi:Rid family detoxifying hydrolase [Candidatus Kinetoplastidibacterium crithidiae]|uniref:TdcF protein n=1 Tax=Candidatus Kinetoplastidibacterium crithidiae TCC036E TaxID=1208918 RepID=M1LU61_9PROT|nr:Rid family detoxifying hydrolase [Candidatus Kinetoplastibacterium crithidii]AFZ82707.1 TdcF protein [Candidatus Kinetoplastibacterium crithidii (ex Angomonas deanei ATCC 30255)]AGF47641.1 TdcF protein [Candidatus Kinetoplastibacterium crithidii TCC036E]
MNKEIIHTNKAPEAVGPYSQAVACSANKLVFLSGQIGLDPNTGKLIEGDFELQVRQSFNNMQAVIEASNATLANVVKMNLFLTDLTKFDVVNKIMSEIFPKPFPSRSTVGVLNLPKSAEFEVEAILAL